MPYIAEHPLSFPEGQIRLDRVYGAPDPEKLAEFQKKIPEITKVTKEFLPVAHEILTNYRSKIIGMVESYVVLLEGKNEIAQQAKDKILHSLKTDTHEISIRDFVTALDKVPSSENYASAYRNAFAKGAGVLDVLSAFKEGTKVDLMDSKVRKMFPELDQLQKATLAYEDRLFKIVGVYNHPLVSSIKETLPDAAYDSRDKQLAEKVVGKFKADLTKIEHTYMTTPSSVEMFTKLSQDLGAVDADERHFMQQEQKHKNLFLGTLDKMLTENGYAASANKLFTEGVVGSESFTAGSRPVVVQINYTPDIVRDMRGDGANESTTKFKMYPSGSIIPEANERGAFVTNLTQPVLGLDAEAVATLNKAGVDNEKIAQWGKNYLRIATMVDHDYLHVMINPRQRAAQREAAAARFIPDYQNLEKSKKNPAFRLAVSGDIEQFPEIPKAYQPTGHLEDFTLSLQAKILNRLFEESPKRKEVVLGRAAESYVQLAEMQKIALANTRGNAAKANVNEAITYLAEIESHRLFRAFPPDDPSLKEKVLVQTTSGVKQMSVTEAMDGIKLISPEHLRSGLSGKSNLAKLTAHAQSVFGDMYHAIHKIDKFPMVDAHSIRNGELKIRYMDSMAILNDAAESIKPSLVVGNDSGKTGKEGRKSRLNGTMLEMPEQVAQQVDNVKTTLAPQSSAIKSAYTGNSVGLGLGINNLHNKLAKEDSYFHQDIKAGGTRESMAKVGIAADVANVSMGGIDIATLIRGGGIAARAFTGTLALPVALLSGISDVNSAVSPERDVKDGHRAVSSLGSTYSGISCGVAGLTIGGSIAGPPGAVAGGLAGAVGCSIAGGQIADKVAGDWVQEKVNYREDPFSYIEAANAKSEFDHGLGSKSAMINAAKKDSGKAK